MVNDRDGLADPIAHCDEALKAAECYSEVWELRCISNLLLQNLEAARADFHKAIEYAVTDNNREEVVRCLMAFQEGELLRKDSPLTRA